MIDVFSLSVEEMASKIKDGHLTSVEIYKGTIILSVIFGLISILLIKPLFNRISINLIACFAFFSCKFNPASLNQIIASLGFNSFAFESEAFAF